ncbi:MAG: hypothetical protein GY865_14415 [candidate division Zixibacteria bacterium]|nr:hypothetical protein [candidate division Zixibacteria bacterium]
MAKYLILLISLLIFYELTSAENVQITTNGGYHARFSPDDSKIAFTDSWNGEPNLFIVDADGSNLTHIETGLSGDYHLCWHPDGTKIYFDARHPSTGVGHIYSIPPAGGTPTMLSILPFGGQIEPNCSPDGTKISFLSSGIAYAPINGGTKVPITSISMSYDWHCWSPDGTKISYCAAVGDWTDNNFDIYTIPIEGGTPLKLTTNTSKDVCPAWSPDGENIVFASDRAGNGNMDLWMIPSKGGTAVQLTDYPGNEHFPHWSHDGRKIIYARYGVEIGLWVLDSPFSEPLCGDTDDSGKIDILDIVFLINFKYKDGPAPEPISIGDTDGSFEIDILDIVYLINFKYKDGPEPIC